ncbi:MAG: ribulose-phosphate 3-epimerase [Cytophagia bacterium]|jgi:ribulose-phosphate 3-epimerase|nr:ribulose-phosphate 3-epimerase [Cytophagia bacterium]
MLILAPSVLSADFARLADNIQAVEGAGADWLHLDVMDGLFVPNLSFGQPVVRAIRAVTSLPLDVHLMIQDPGRYLEAFAQAGADVLTVHLEACVHLHRNIQQIKSLGLQAGVALNPHTPVESLWPVLPDLDLVCLMSVNPGFGGQAFIPSTMNKLAALDRYRKEHGLTFRIEIDGGVDLQNAASLMQAGADVLVAGNSVFGQADAAQAVRAFKAIR